MSLAAWQQLKAKIIFMLIWKKKKPFAGNVRQK